MTDRELLEMAAKAAGMTDRKWSGSGMALMYDPSRPETTGSIGPDWNPLTDDGDALRLAVKLKMDAFVFTSGFSEAVCPMGPVVREPHGDDPCAATRRAIVRAAAEIGRSM